MDSSLNLLCTLNSEHFGVGVHDKNTHYPFGSATRNTSKVPTRIVETNGGMKWQGKANGA